MGYLDYLQKLNDFCFEKFGLNSLTLGLQVKINKKRHLQNQHDPSEVVFVDDEGNEFVQ